MCIWISRNSDYNWWPLKPKIEKCFFGYLYICILYFIVFLFLFKALSKTKDNRASLIVSAHFVASLNFDVTWRVVYICHTQANELQYDAFRIYTCTENMGPSWKEFPMVSQNRSRENKTQPPARGRRESRVVQKPVLMSGKKAEVKVEGKTSWFCKDPSSCMFFFFFVLLHIQQCGFHSSEASAGRKTTEGRRAAAKRTDTLQLCVEGKQPSPGPRAVCPLRGSLARRLFVVAF